MVTRVWFVISLLIAATTASALDRTKDLDQFTIDIWKSGQGLPVNSVTAVSQTIDGYLWLGTQKGLIRFDGIGSRVFDRRNTPALATSIIWSLLATKSGDLWIGLEDGGAVVLRDGQFVPLGFEPLISATVMALHESEEGDVWIGTEDGRVFRVSDGSVHSCSPPEGLGGIIREFVSAGPGAVWIASEGSGLWRIEADGTLFNLTTKNGLPTDVVVSLGKDRNGVLWIGTHAGGAVRFDGEEMKVFTVEQGLAHDTINDIIEDRDGNVWFATQLGLSRLRPSGVISTLSASQGLGATVVRCLLEDREGSLWIGTGGGGLCRLKDTPVTTFSTRQGLEFDHVWTVFEDRRGTIWIGTNGGGLYRMRDQQIGRAFTTTNGLSNDTVLSLAETNDGSLWVGTRAGLNRIRNGSIRVYSVEDGLPNSFVRVLFYDSKDRLWVGTRGGLAVYKRDDFKTFGIADGLTNDVIRFVFEARDGTIWIGTNGGGLNRFDGTTFSAITPDDGLSSGYIFAIYEDGSGTIWAGSNEGLNRVRNGHVDSLTIDDGLPDDFFYRIMSDGTGRLWASTNAGILTVPVAALNRAIDEQQPIEQFRLFGAADGMANAECNGGVQPAGWKDRRGRLWFPTVQGVVRVDATSVRTNPVPPNVVIERVIADGTARDWSQSEELHLAAGTTRFELHYAALSFVDPTRVRYRYRLEGFDTGWTDADTRRTAYYTNVPPGHYSFEVTGCNNDGVWSSSPAVLELEIPPTFRQTAWMAVVYIAAALGLVAVFLILRSQQIRRREKRLLELVDERTAQLEAANRRLESLVHLDGLTGIPNRRHFIERYKKEWDRCIRNAKWLSVILADIDDFKAFNDTYGHQTGDECLKLVAKVLDSGVHRPADVVARYGGEEFVVLLPETELDGATAVAEAMRRSIEGLAIPHRTSRAGHIVTVSFGVAGLMPGIDDRSATLIDAADGALYQAKEAGRNRTVTASTATDSSSAAAGS